MDEDRREVVPAIDAVESVDGTDDFCRLHALAGRYFALPDAADHLDVWFRLYERFPNTDADYAFWSILHRIEARPGYERLVAASLRRRPAWLFVSGTLRADDVPFHRFGQRSG